MTFNDYLKQRIKDSEASIFASWVTCGILFVAAVVIGICLATFIEKHSDAWEILYILLITFVCNITFNLCQIRSKVREKHYDEVLLKINSSKEN